MKSEAATTGDAPAGTPTPEEAGTSPSKRADRYLCHIDPLKGGSQKPHPAKQAQGKVLHHLG